MFIGVDGHAKGWVTIAIDGRGFVAAHSFASFEALMAAHREAKVIAVDIPIGLIDAPSREADGAARAFLRGHASSVFNAPPRSALNTSYEEASTISRKICDKGLSKQSYALFPKIREVDAYERDQRIFEVHPEVSFRLMLPAQPLGRKKTWGGLHARLARLASQGIALPSSLGEADEVGIDDVVDAAAAAWSGRRLHAGTARSFPAQPTQHSASKRPLAIWG